MTTWELRGGPWDGLVVQPTPASIQRRVILLSDCPAHGQGAICECGDSVWFAYFEDTDRPLHFVEIQ